MIPKLEHVIMVGDRVLIQPVKSGGKTASGLYLPPTVTEKEEVQSGYVIRTGPGIPIGKEDLADEPWKQTEDKASYLPLQAKIGDLAVYLMKHSLEVEIDQKKYLIVPQGAILMLFRDDLI
jgi:chaperonin GroES